MKLRNTCQIIGFYFVASFFIAGCGEEKMPEVNEKNCEIENIQKIKNRELQQAFSGKCIRRDTSRSGEFTPSKEVKW